MIDASLPLLVPGRAAFCNVVGYALGEERRACGGQTYDHPGRTSEYPLIAWGWDRETSISYLREQFGITWHKSACVQCPFAFHRAPGANDDLLARYLAEPDGALRALQIEHGARCVNPILTLTVSGALRDRFAADARFAAVLERFTALLDATEHKLLSVRRVVEGRGLVYRSIRTLDRGTSVEMTRALVARSGGNVVGEGYTTEGVSGAGAALSPVRRRVPRGGAVVD